MKLLIITQKVDKNDPILGFFHRWIQEFAKQVEHVTVIGQFVGEHTLPANVTIKSLGKEKGKSRIGQIFQFWKYQKEFRNDYDAVLVHMTPIWVVLGCHLWKKFNKPMYLWYEARGGGWALPKAVAHVRKVFGATAYGLPLRSARHVIIGHGIDTEMFSLPEIPRDPTLVTAIGRMTRVKRYDVILKAFATLPEKYYLEIRGVTITPSDAEALQKFMDLRHTLHLEGRVAEVAPATHAQIPALLKKASLFLHAAEGGLDKAILEAMSCGCPVVTSSHAARGVLPEICVATEETMADKAKALLALSQEKREELGKQLRQIVLENHSLSRLVDRMVKEMQG